jgi:immunity protein, SdpI family
MSNRIADGLSLLAIAITVGIALYLWPELPDPMPSHFNAAGEVDDYLPKFWGVALIPLISLSIIGVMKIIPAISPKGFRTNEFRNVLHIFQLTLVVFMSFVGVLVMLQAIGSNLPLNQLILGAMGVLFLIIGNYFTKVRKNFFLGIRTPWTLASDEVWYRTHRLGGRLFMLGGLLFFVSAFFRVTPTWVIAVIVICSTYPILHSYLLYRRIEGFDEGTSKE